MAIPSGYTPLDLVGFTDKGTYANNVPYVKNDLVHYGGDIWKCKVDNTTGVTPVDGVNWEIFIGEPTNLVERIIAPLETNPATVAYTIGRQIIYDDWLWKVIAPIAIGDTLVDYAVDPSNANIKKALAVETQLLSLSSKAYQTDDSTETDIADDDMLPFYDTSATTRKKSTWGNIIAKIKAKLGTAATKDSTTSVTSGSANLVTSGGVYASEQAIKQALTAKVNTSDIANNLTTTTEGKVLDARQGKTLNDKEQATRNSIAPTEDSTNYSKSYSKGDEFYRNGTLYKVTASSVNTSTAINTGSGGNATSAGSITSQINPLLYYQTGTASNGWTDTTGTWTVTRKGNVVEVQIDLVFLNNLAALQALHIRDMPSWAKPSTNRNFTRKIPAGSEIFIEFKADNTVYVTAYSAITAGGYNFYDTITYLV